MTPQMTQFSRRHFLTTAAVVTAGLSALPIRSQDLVAKTRMAYPPVLYKALIAQAITEETCARWAAAGFDGIELQHPTATFVEARAARQIAEKHGLRIHSVMIPWSNFQKPESFEEDIDTVKTALRTAAAFGADNVIWNPVQLPGQKTPSTWDFEIDFDPKTLEIRSVTAGDNTPYAAYIDNYHRAKTATIRGVEQLIPVAAKEGVRLGIENVRNNMWNTPELFAAFCTYFDSPWLACYFDLGNALRYSRCEDWLRVLGKNIFKLHIKDFKLDEVRGSRGGGPGNFVPLGQGSIDFVSVRQILHEIGYTGWVTIETGKEAELDGHSDEQHSQLLDDFFAGSLSH